MPTAEPARRPVLTPLAAERDLGLVDALAQLSFVIQGVLGHIVAAHGASIVQARLLGILRDRRPTVNELAHLLQLDKSSVTGLVDRAEERGLVSRAPSSTDGRSVQVNLTPAGRRLIDRAVSEFEAEISGLVAGLSQPQLDQLSATATLIVAEDARRRGVKTARK